MQFSEFHKKTVENFFLKNSLIINFVGKTNHQFLGLNDFLMFLKSFIKTNFRLVSVSINFVGFMTWFEDLLYSGGATSSLVLDQTLLQPYKHFIIYFITSKKVSVRDKYLENYCEKLFLFQVRGDTRTFFKFWEFSGNFFRANECQFWTLFFSWLIEFLMKSEFIINKRAGNSQMRGICRHFEISLIRGILGMMQCSRK